MSNFAEDLDQLVKDNDNRIPSSGEEGYPIVLKDVKRELSDKEKKDMFVFIWKIQPKTAEEKKSMRVVKGKEIRKYYVMTNKYARQYLLEMVKKMGGDLTTMKNADDIEDFFDSLDSQPKARVKLTNELDENGEIVKGSYADLKFFDITKAVVDKEDKGDEDEINAPD